MTNQAPVSRKKGTEKPNPIINLSTSGLVLNKTEDFNNIVIMSGTAKRKPFEKKENRSVGSIPKSNFTFSKLRVPFSKPHQKHAQTEEKLITKSCEVLFECIKPYKDIRVARKTHVKETIRNFGSILTTDIVYERKATRKVQFFSFFGDNPRQSLMTNNHSQVLTSELDPENLGVGGWEPDELQSMPNPNPGKTVSSEDFITNAFPNPQ